MLKIRLVVTGGQTGADQGGLKAARAANLSTGGWAPRGWQTESGPALWLAEYGLKEHTGGYRERTIANVQILADMCRGRNTPFPAMIWFGDASSPGGRLTLAQCRRHGVGIQLVFSGKTTRRGVAEWLFHEITVGGMTELVLMIAGNRQSKSPGIEERVQTFMADVFGLLEMME